MKVLNKYFLEVLMENNDNFIEKCYLKQENSNFKKLTSKQELDLDNKLKNLQVTMTWIQIFEFVVNLSINENFLMHLDSALTSRETEEKATAVVATQTEEHLVNTRSLLRFLSWIPSSSKIFTSFWFSYPSIFL